MIKGLKIAASVVVIIGGVVFTAIVSDHVGEVVTEKLVNWIES